MKRGLTGHFEPISLVGEKCMSFVPNALPPVPPVQLTSTIQSLLEQASLALGRLDGLTSTLPDPHLFLYTYARKEAVLSSQIEGTQSSLSDLLLFEMEAAPGVPLDDVREVSSYVAALNHGTNRLRKGFPLSNRLIRETHEVLLSTGRGSEKNPGQFRTSQNWIGGSRPGNAAYVPPPPHHVMPALTSLEKFLHEEDGLPLLIRAALAHAQFETIHPFLDGNGRMGRLLITFLLCARGALAEPILYLSLYLRKYRDTYFQHLQAIRHDGDWESWIEFFLQGVRDTAAQAAQTARDLLLVAAGNNEKISQLARKAGTALRAHSYLQQHPITTVRALASASGLSMPGSLQALERLQELGIVREVTGKRRNRIFVYEEYLARLNEDIEI